MEMKRMENYGQRQQKAWITMTLIVLNILYFVYLEAVGSSAVSYTHLRAIGDMPGRP